ncbi:DNA cytosine methyltransferase [Microbacterium sp. Gd 4-13]|uniref:DNA cytosine methyltransferase n=1 Tax=Microbacterium sp. Gd 4-13 TaxID=2173179 RepID=UPI001F0B88ED|nr:DNA cytosine methyltransferase [Microbacterium sp. Gd 4-13]
MHESNGEHDNRRLRVGSLFSGYGGLDLAVEQVFDARTVWFSEINDPVARVFAHHWPDAPNLGDITTIDWSTVEPVDVLCGGFPCQDVSTVGKRAGLAPGTRSGLWAHMATAIEALQPEWVVIENVRGLLSAPAIRPRPIGDDDERRNPDTATPGGATLRSVEPTRGVWETSQPDLYGRLAPYSETWPTSGTTHDGSAYPLPRSAHPIPDSASLSAHRIPGCSAGLNPPLSRSDLAM